MGEVVRGLITDRPWGLTFGQFGARGVTGQLVVHGDGRELRVAFADGRIVGATSPLAADAATRVAMTLGFVSSSQAPIVARQIAATPEVDEIALLTSSCRLNPTQVQQLRRRVMVQRAARTFGIEQGTFHLEDPITIATSLDVDVDVRPVIYLGARMNLSERRLAAELRDLGLYFTLEPTALEHADRFGFDAVERPILDALRERTTLAALQARHRDLDPRNVQAVIYALVSCRECLVERDAENAEDFVQPQTTSQIDVAVSFTTTPSGTHALPRPAVGTVEIEPKPAPMARMPSPTPITDRTTTLPTPPSRYADDRPVPRATASGAKSAVHGAVSAPEPEVQTPTPRPPPSTTPTALPPPDPAVERAAGSGSFSMPRTISQTTTGAPNERVYSEGTDRTREAFSEAAEAFKRGQAALRDNQIELARVHLSTASTLNPHEFDYSAVLAFAQFVAASTAERTKTADKVRKMLNHATQKSRDPEQARFYLGQVEQLLGRNKEALAYFQTILSTVPDHTQALAAIQTIENKAVEKTGFGFFRKK